MADPVGHTVGGGHRLDEVPATTPNPTRMSGANSFLQTAVGGLLT